MTDPVRVWVPSISPSGLCFYTGDRFPGWKGSAFTGALSNEALFRTGIKPQLAAGKLSRERCTRLAEEIRATLQEAIAKGGSTLRDFVNSDGKPGYFQQHYWAYGRTGEPCRRCGTPIRQIKQGQRSSFYCPACQR